ncbi:TetR/AcrR family transcriptional regulator [Microbacterium stercoris]|uniref:TetR family transcriptional regulator n=1 Tax=Microbacterium stercoris TaxID=2820289 RepID=A0A939TYN4_9MICO|nr:TetR family transcriptional regulator [Microbacterium stercoris]MBO3664892.1 TetR family transcriptional regulator [Microbacterium stercoris]
MSTSQRARSDEAKRARESAILDAARVLGERDGVLAVTLTGIAAEIGMHKSALLRYFETREEIFLRLAADDWVAWGAEVSPGLREARTPAAAGRLLADSLAARPFFCDLLAHTALSLERNVSAEGVRRFKLTVLAQVVALAEALHTGIPSLGAQGARDVISAAVTLAGGLWQMATPGPVLAELYRTDPDVAHAAFDFGPALRRHLTAMLEGLAKG